MMDKKNVSRLGEILVEKGLVTSQQLDVAVKEQIRRRQRIDPLDSKLRESTSLGEILIELGFINRLQLNRGLNWQLLLRKLTMAMALLAPLMTMSTGATAQSSATSSVSSSTQSTASKTLPVTIQAEDYSSMSGIKTQATTDTGGGLNVGYVDNGDWISYSGTVVSIPVTGVYKITYRIASPGGGGSFALKEATGNVTYDTVTVPNTGDFQQWVNVERLVSLSAGNHSFMINFIARGQGINLNWFKIESVGSSSSSSVSSSSKPSSSSNSSVASSQTSSSTVSTAAQTSSTGTVVTVSGGVGLAWRVPTMRENGDPLDITELGGYELRFRTATNENFTYITINDPWTNYYNFSWLVGDYIFQVAAFDKSGVYSNFVDVTPL